MRVLLDTNILISYLLTPKNSVMAQIVEAGVTSLATSDHPAAPPSPAFLLLGSYFDLSTTAQYAPLSGVTIRVTYKDPGLTPAQEQAIALLHYQNGQWVDCTMARDPVANTVTGHVSSLSWFVLGTGFVSGCDALSAIGSTFNGTPIAGNDTIWFNAVAKVSGRSGQGELRFTRSRINFSVGGVPYVLEVPPSIIRFRADTMQATSVFEDGIWQTGVPVGYTGNVFLSGMAFKVPPDGLPGGINPVTWQGNFSTDTSGLSVSWKWGAAVYTSFASAGQTYGQVGVKPIDGDTQNPYRNSNHAGTPENYKAYVIGGARGGGGSNWTGSYSGTGSVTPCIPR